MFWGTFFEKFISPVFHGGSRLRKFPKKSKKNLNIQKCPNSFAKVSKRVLNVFWGEFFEKIFDQCSMEGRVFKNFQKNQKNFKIPKMPKIVPKSIQTCFEQFLGPIFPKKFCPVFHGVSSLRNFSKKIKKTFKIPTKNAQNRSQKNPKLF